MTDTSKLWPPDGAAPINWWGHLAGKLGASPSLPRPFLICLRGVEPFKAEDHELVARPGYTDTGVLLSTGAADVFPMSSVPYQTRSKESPDVDGDGLGDVACIKPGRYVLTDKNIQPYPIFVLTNPGGSGEIPCSRDLRHDGKIDHEGPAIYTATAVLLHTGIDGAKLNPPSSHTSSIACQCTSLPRLNLIRQRLHEAKTTALDYVLVNARDAVPLMADFDPGSEPVRVG